MIRWLQNWWWARQRQIDMRILWPICVQQAGDLERAKAAFMVHAIVDPAWCRFYEGNLWAAINAFTADTEVKHGD